MAHPLEEIRDALVASYAGPEAINNLESCRLPNRRAVIGAFAHLQHLLFMGFYSTRSLTPENLGMSLAEHLLPAHDALVEQIGRAVAFEDRRGDAECRDDGFAGRVVLDLLRALPTIRSELDGDVGAAFEHDPAAESLEEVVYSYPGIRAITAYRIAHRLHRAGVPLVPRMLTEHAHAETGIDLHPAAVIGRRLSIDHGTGLVVGATAIVGDDVRLYHGVTLGALSIPRNNRSAAVKVKRHPTLEDGVTVYAGATILGGDTVIGRGSVIGGNVWITRSVPAFSKIVFQPHTNPRELPDAV